MDLNFTPEEEAFRAEVQAFLKDKLPARIANKVKAGQRLTKADQDEWHAILNERGWLANHWPEEYGGRNLPLAQQIIFHEEYVRCGGPGRIGHIGETLLAPTVMAWGTPEQKQRFLPGVLAGTDYWAQGYSEPGAGSDLASVKTTAVRQGDHYVVNGQKTWTTQGQHANMIFCLVRTDREARPQSGISFLLVDMNTPGVEVRPIRTLDGDREVNEVFFTDVRVPAENLVGEENKGWTYAKFLLTYERTGIAGVGFSVASLEKLKVVASKVQRNGRPLAQNPQFAARMAKVEIDLENMKTTNLRVIAAVAHGSVPGAESSMLKIRGTEIRQEILSLIRRAMGPYALPFIEAAQYEGYADAPVGPKEAATAAANYFNYRKLSIFGGSNEIQKNIISKMILGL